MDDTLLMKELGITGRERFMGEEELFVSKWISKLG